VPCCWGGGASSLTLFFVFFLAPPPGAPSSTPIHPPEVGPKADCSRRNQHLRPPTHGHGCCGPGLNLPPPRKKSTDRIRRPKPSRFETSKRCWRLRVPRDLGRHVVLRRMTTPTDGKRYRTADCAFENAARADVIAEADPAFDDPKQITVTTGPSKGPQGSSISTKPPSRLFAAPDRRTGSVSL